MAELIFLSFVAHVNPLSQTVFLISFSLTRFQKDVAQARAHRLKIVLPFLHTKIQSKPLKGNGLALHFFFYRGVHAWRFEARMLQPVNGSIQCFSFLFLPCNSKELCFCSQSTLLNCEPVYGQGCKSIILQS